MSLNPHKLVRNFAFRLSLWYAGIFILTSAILLAVVYWLVATALQRNDEEVLRSKLHEYATVYQADGPGGLALRARKENDPNDERAFYVMLNTPTFRASAAPVFSPNGWLKFQPLEVQWEPTAITRVPKNPERDFAVARAFLPDGSVLYVG
jgi:hypothetical protein